MNGEKLTPKEALVFAVGEALEFFSAHEEKVINRGATVDFYQASKGDKVPEYTIEAYIVMKTLLEDPSIESVSKLAELASKIYGHRNWLTTVLGVLTVIAGIVIILEFPVLSLILGTQVPLIYMVCIVPALSMLGLGIGTFINSSPSNHSAALYKVEAAAKELPELKQPSFIASFFASDPKNNDSSEENSVCTELKSLNVHFD